MVKAPAIIALLMVDIVSHEFEQKRGHAASAVECLLPTEVPMPLLVRILNLTRVVDVIYKDEDNYTIAGTKLRNYVESMNIEPLTM